MFLRIWAKLICGLEFPVSTLVLSRISSVLQGNFWDSTVNYVIAASVHILSNSSMIFQSSDVIELLATPLPQTDV
jgi:hypothetical protein